MHVVHNIYTINSFSVHMFKVEFGTGCSRSEREGNLTVRKPTDGARKMRRGGDTDGN